MLVGGLYIIKEAVQTLYTVNCTVELRLTVKLKLRNKK